MPGVLRCARGHAFDIAREGYVNLLLSRSRTPGVLGDAKPMLRARRRFLEAGHYESLSDRINELLQVQLPRFWDQKPVAIIDVGCGEGYFTGRLQEELSRHRPDVCVFGTDIAKEAARLGSKRYANTRFVVADTRQQLPFVGHSAAIILNVFAPRNIAEFSRMSAYPGILLVVIPGEDHLWELRLGADLLEIEKEKRQKIVSLFGDHFELDSIQGLSYSMELESAQLEDLLQMTPNYWHMSEDERQRLTRNGPGLVTASFELLLFQSASSGRPGS
jgi:23S rRNA (guanine745-N1)-methyltransferase